MRKETTTTNYDKMGFLQHLNHVNMPLFSLNAYSPAYNATITITTTTNENNNNNNSTIFYYCQLFAQSLLCFDGRAHCSPLTHPPNQPLHCHPCALLSYLSLPYYYFFVVFVQVYVCVRIFSAPCACLRSLSLYNLLLLQPPLVCLSFAFVCLHSTCNTHAHMHTYTRVQAAVHKHFCPHSYKSLARRRRLKTADYIIKSARKKLRSCVCVWVVINDANYTRKGTTPAVLYTHTHTYLCMYICVFERQGVKQRNTFHFFNIKKQLTQQKWETFLKWAEIFFYFFFYLLQF